MPTTVNDVTQKTEMLEIDPKSSEALKSTTNGKTNEQQNEKLEGKTGDKTVEKEEQKEAAKDGVKEENVPVEVEPKTGLSFPVVLEDGKQLNALGMRKKSMLGLGIKIYGFGKNTFFVFNIIIMHSVSTVR